MLQFQRILVPVDFQPLSQKALQYADELAAQSNATLTILHALELPPTHDWDAPATRSEALATLRKHALASLTSWTEALRTPQNRKTLELRDGHPVSVVVDASARYDLVVMPTHGRQGAQYLMMGSVAERIVRGAHCAVLVIRP